MPPSINQNALKLALPEMRNLGTILRILLAVNALVLIATVIREPRWGSLSATWLELVAVAEPPLLLELLVLYMIAPWLERAPFELGAFLVLVLAPVVTLGWDAAMGFLLGPTTTSTSLRHTIFAMGIAAFMLYYFQLRSKALSPAITEARLQALQARIRPHFLFNSITAVLSLVRSEPRRAETALEDLADLFRVLMRDNRQLTPLGDEVQLCRQYLDLEKLRLGDRLGVEWHIDNMPTDAMVPPLVLQPLLENAVYHGIEPSSVPGVIAINIFLRRGEVHAVLRNPYQARGNHHGGNKMAIANIRERLALHFDAEASLESKMTKESYEVHIRMPYRPGSVDAESHD